MKRNKVSTFKHSRREIRRGKIKLILLTKTLRKKNKIMKISSQSIIHYAKRLIAPNSFYWLNPLKINRTNK